MASATQKQTRNNLKPLIRLLKAKKAEKDILRRVEKIVDKCLEREYVEANEEYMMLAIGTLFTVNHFIHVYLVDVINLCIATNSHEVLESSHHTTRIFTRHDVGNSAWPMGVTMVGIHERAGREKIFSQSVAHVLNNEEQRKYVQALKRIMTFCQTKYPNVPSKMVRV